MNTETLDISTRPARQGSTRRRWYRQPWASVSSRVCAAIFAGYALSAVCVGLLARLLALDSLAFGKVEAVLTATLSGFAIYASAIITAFALRTATRAWLYLLTPTLLLGLALWLLQKGGSA